MFTQSRNVAAAKLLLLATGVLCLCGASTVRAADDSAGITVTGSGQAKGKPVMVEMSGVVSGEGELAADAIVKYRDTKKRATKAIEGLKLANLTIESNGYSISQAMDANQQMMIMQGRGGTPGKQKVQVSEQLKLVLKDADKLKPEELIETILKVVDAARDAGLQIGPPPATNYYQMQIQAQSGQGSTMASFKIPDPAALREQAYKQAIDDARTKAKRLADLAGVKLGAIRSVQDGGPVKGQDPQTAMMAAMYGMVSHNDEQEMTSAMYSDIAVKINLTVQFEIQK